MTNTPNQPKPTVAPSLVIARTEFPKWWKNLALTSINISTLGAQIIVPWLGGKKKYLVSLFFVCDGETDIQLRIGGTPITGPMSFGGSDEPRGMVLQLAEAPIPVGADILSIYSEPKTPPVQVSGTAVYYTETD